MQKDRAQADGRPVHEDEFPGRRDAPQTAQFPVHLTGDPGPIDAAFGFLDTAFPVLHQRRIDKPRPVVEDLDHLQAEVGEAPGLVGADRQVLVLVAQSPVEVDDGADETRLEDPDTAEIDQVDGAVRAHRIIAQVGVAVNDAVVIERQVPGMEHVHGDGVAGGAAVIDKRHQRRALQPVHGQQAVGRQLRHRLRYDNAGVVLQHVGIERHVVGFAPVIQFLVQPVRQFGMDFRRVDGPVVTPVEGEDQFQLPEVGLHRRSHGRVLQLAGQVQPVMADRPVHLSEGGGGRRLSVE